jgi:thioredoxin reductase
MSEDREPAAIGETRYDVLVVGGGAAGLSGALALARACRTVLVIDDGAPRNTPAAGVHNYLGREGIAPAALLAIGRAEVTGYGGQIVSDRAVTARPLPTDGNGVGFETTLADGTRVRSRRMLVTSGVVDELPDVAGLAQRWGRDVLHCAYCHGWEVRDQAIGVLATGPRAVHQAQLFRQWSAHVTLFLHTGPEPTDEQWAQLAARDIAVVDGEVTALEVLDDTVTGLRLRGGRIVPCQAVAVTPWMTARADVLTSLGLHLVEQQIGDHPAGTVVAADDTGATTVPGVWVAGNVADAHLWVINAAAAGLTAAAAINNDLTHEDVLWALAATREEEYRRPNRASHQPFSAQAEADITQRVLGDRRHGL